MLKSRVWSKTGDLVSEVGLGCWQLGGADWGYLADQDAYSILRAAVDSGVTFLDTADVYGQGRSESLIGSYFGNSKERPFIATKVGRLELYPDGYTRDSVRRMTAASMKRLGVDTLDLTQLHCVPTQVLQQGEIFGWLEEMRQDGWIRNWGASVESVDEGLLCLEHTGISSLQIIFNLFRQKPAEKLLAEAETKGVSIIVRLPYASGVLTGKFSEQTVFAPEDHRHYNRDGKAFNVGETFAGLPYLKAVELSRDLQCYLPSGWTLAELAMRWILDFSAVTTVIPGASRVDQVLQNVAASALPPLSKETHQQLAQFYREHVARYVRGVY
jgi:aryl-alcohol dehydrogenase-like predicted oxidoreductase